MKRAIIVHYWEGYPDYCWYPQAKRGLESAGFDVSMSEMPEKKTPKPSPWLSKLREVVGKPDESLLSYRSQRRLRRHNEINEIFGNAY